MSDNSFFQSPEGEKKHHKIHTPIEQKLQGSISSFKDFINDQITASLFLILSAFIAIVWISIEPISAYYLEFQSLVIRAGVGDFIVKSSLQHFVNDFLMTFFFFLLGLEIKKEFLAGELQQASIRNTVLFAAIGGVIAPALIFVILSPDQYDLRGWGIPVATDTAFALGILALFRNKVPSSLFTFVAALAVIDDLVAILILALFYTPSIHPVTILLAACSVLILMIFNLIGIRRYLPYLIVGCIVWWFIEHSGLHGTFAGVLVAMTIPARPKSGPKKLIEKVDHLTSKLQEREKAVEAPVLEDDKKQEIIEKIEGIAQDSAVPLTRLQHKIEPAVVLLILPIFALLNAGVPITAKDIQAAFSHALPFSLFFALVLGKCIGISLATYLSCRLGIGKLPQDNKFGHIFGVSILAGIGFTMSIFIAELAFGGAEEIIVAKTGVFAASMFASIAGIIYFHFYTKNRLAYQ